MKLILSLVLMLVFVSCEDKTHQTRKSLSDATTGGCSSGAVATSATGPLFKIGDTVVTRADLPAKMREAVYQSEYESFSKNQNIFKEYALRVHLAKKSGKYKDGKDLPELTSLLNIPTPSDKDVENLFNQSKGRLPEGTTLAQMKPQIINYLKQQKVVSAFREEVKKMEDAGVYQSLVTGPEAPEIKINTEGFAQMGDKSSKIQIIEVADYTCGHCQRAHGQVKELLKKYKGKVNFTQINFALRPEGKSGMYVKAAYCAQMQSVDKFWAFHDNAFTKTSEPHDHSDPHHSHAPNPTKDRAEVVAVAKKSGLDMKSLEKCLDGAESKDKMMKTNSMLSNLGISGTPVFIVNDKKLAGGVGELEKVIKELL